MMVDRERVLGLWAIKEIAIQLRSSLSAISYRCIYSLALIVVPAFFVTSYAEKVYQASKLVGTTYAAIDALTFNKETK